jgi:hypothetical protein
MLTVTNNRMILHTESVLLTNSVSNRPARDAAARTRLLVGEEDQAGGRLAGAGERAVSSRGGATAPHRRQGSPGKN